MLTALLLAAALAILWGTGRRRRGPRPMPEDRRTARRAAYRGWTLRLVTRFLLPSVAALAVLGRLDALMILPPEFAPAAAMVGPMGIDDLTLFGVGLAGGIGGTLVGAAWWRWRGRRGVGGPMLGNPGALLPRRRDELPHAALLAITAGVAEEPFFRLLLPLLMAMLGIGAVAGFVAAAVLFGLAHRSQGWVGMVATGVLSLLFAALYLATGRLWVAMAFHVLLDLIALVLRPALTGAWRTD